jgi:N-acyl-D-amino-acid deacylase
MFRKGLPSLLVVLASGWIIGPDWAQQPQPKEDYPITGKAGPDLEPLDKAVLAMMRRHGIPGAALAIAKDGRLVYAKGFGWADLATGKTVSPDTLFGLASLSKPITALAILKLLEQGKLKLEDLAFDYLKHLQPLPGAKVDPRLKTITIYQLLNHSGGWNRNVSGDPTTWSPQIARAMRVKLPLTSDQFISFIMGLRLDFDPGSEAQYSNVGYVILGQIVEKASGKGYEEYVRENVLEPMGAKTVGMNSLTKYLPGEARRYLAGTEVMLPPMQLPMIKAAGGWSGSTLDMVRLLTALDGSRGKPFLSEKTMKLFLTPPPAPIKVQPNKTFPGLGFEMVYVGQDGYGYFQDGLWHGMRAFMKRSPKGINWALTFNASMQPDLVDAKVARAALQEIQETVERTKNYPKVDLFKDFK